MNLTNRIAAMEGEGESVVMRLVRLRVEGVPLPDDLDDLERLQVLTEARSFAPKDATIEAELTAHEDYLLRERPESYAAGALTAE